MNNKTCGECRFYHPIFKHEGSCTATSDLRKTCDFTIGCAIGGVYPKPPPTNGDKIRQMSNAELALLDKCEWCMYFDGVLCTKPDDKTCADGIEPYLNAPAESEVKDE